MFLFANMDYLASREEILLDEWVLAQDSRPSSSQICNNNNSFRFIDILPFCLSILIKLFMLHISFTSSALVVVFVAPSSLSFFWLPQDFVPPRLRAASRTSSFWWIIQQMDAWLIVDCSLYNIVSIIVVDHHLICLRKRAWGWGLFNRYFYRWWWKPEIPCNVLVFLDGQTNSKKFTPKRVMMSECGRSYPVSQKFGLF